MGSKRSKQKSPSKVRKRFALGIKFKRPVWEGSALSIKILKSVWEGSALEKSRQFMAMLLIKSKSVLCVGMARAIREHAPLVYRTAHWAYNEPPILLLKDKVLIGSPPTKVLSKVTPWDPSSF